MDTQKILKPVEKPVIISDYREREIGELLKNLGAVLTQENLEIGDFICSDRVVIERKAHSDFVSSIIDGRLFEQIENMKRNFEKNIVLVEGSSDRKINENALKAALAVMATDGVSVISTKNPKDTAKTIFWIAKKEQEEKKKGIGFRVGKKPMEEAKLKEMVVAGLPGISSIISKRLLENFGTVEKVFSASEDQLRQVKGIGDKLAKKIRKLITGNYSEV